MRSVINGPTSRRYASLPGIRVSIVSDGWYTNVGLSSNDNARLRGKNLPVWALKGEVAAFDWLIIRVKRLVVGGSAGHLLERRSLR